jgi:hypothetical protein
MSHAEFIFRCRGRTITLLPKSKPARLRSLLGLRFEFKARYATFGFSPEANLDEGNMWPTSFALKELTAADEAKIAEP